MPSESIIAVAFKLINFIVIVASAWYIFLRYFSSTISEKIIQKKRRIISLEEQTLALRRAQLVVDERTMHNKKYAEILGKKIQRWYDYVEDQRRQEAKQDGFIQAAIKHKQDQQQKRIKQQWLYRQIFPQAFKKVKGQLEEKYASEEKQEQFINSIIQMMKY